MHNVGRLFNGNLVIVIRLSLGFIELRFYNIRIPHRRKKREQRAHSAAAWDGDNFFPGKSSASLPH